LQIHSRLFFEFQIIGEIKMSGLFSPLKGFYRLTLLYLTKPAYRKAVNDIIRDAIAIPKHFMKSL